MARFTALFGDKELWDNGLDAVVEEYDCAEEDSKLEAAAEAREFAEEFLIPGIQLLEVRENQGFYL